MVNIFDVTERFRPKWLLLFIALLGCLLRTYDLGAKSFWVDELISLRHAASIYDLGSFLRACCGNMHPPLYFLVLKLWSALFLLIIYFLVLLNGYQRSSV